MYSAFGIVTPADREVWVDGLQTYRSIGAFSFMGRYRVIDFSISNMSNSDIDRIQVYIRRKPFSLMDHLGTGRHYNINSKRGRLQVMVSENNSSHNAYNTDVAAYLENIEYIKKMHFPYVVIAPSYMVFTQDYSKLIETHVESGADITLLYHSVDNAKDSFLNNHYLELNKQKGVLHIEKNHGTAKSRNIFMETYVLKTELFLELLDRAKNISSMYTFSDIVNYACDKLDIRGVAHRGYFASITDFDSYYEANMSLIDLKNANELFVDEWPIYTKTNDSCPTKYLDDAEIKTSIISNGCTISGTVENSIIGRGCIIEEGAVVKNSIILSGSVISKDAHVEYQVVDKGAHITSIKEIVSTPNAPGYVRKDDIV